MLPPSLRSKNNSSKKPAWSFSTYFMLVSCLVYSSTMNIEVTSSSETSVDFRWTTQNYIPEDRTLQSTTCL
jgi:hypothetical protein